ncbi:MAG: fibronectin type III domain-containing protein [Bacteroidota bacterium]
MFYSNGGNLDDIANWGDQTDGSVSIPAYAPANFTTPGTTFIVSNGPINTITGNWVLSGANTKVVVASGQTFTIPSGFSLSTNSGATIDVQANGILDIINSSIPTFGILDVASTVIFDGTTQSIPGSLVFSYGNLKLIGGTKTITGLFNSNPIEVKGDFTIDNSTVTSNLSGSQEQTIGLWGDLNIINGVTYLAGWNGFVNYEAKGTANQIIYGNGFSVNCKKFYLNINNLSAATNLKPSGSVTLSNLSGGTNLVLTNTLKLNCGNTTPANTATFVDNGQTITVGGDVEMAGSAANYTLTGTVVLTGTSGTVNLRQDGGAGSTLVLKANLKNLSIQTSGNTVTQVQPASGSATLNILGNFTIGGTSTGKFTPFGNVIKIGGNFSDTRIIDMIAAGTSTFEFNGTSAQTFLSAYSVGESFFNVKINNAFGVNMTGASNFKITSTGNLNMAVGILNTGTGKVILNNTATISEPLNGSSFVQGKVETTRTLATGTPETFGGLGIDVTPSLNATTTCARVIGNTSAIGCANSSTLRYFDFTASTVTSPTSVVYHYFDTNYEMNNFDEGDVSIFQSNTPYTTWTVVPLAQTVLDSNNNKLTLTGLTSLSRVTLSVAAPSGGNAIPAGGTAIARTTMVCPNASTTITINGFGQGTVQWQQSSNGLTGWTNVIGGSGATSLTYTTPALNTTTYYRGLVSNSCFDVASTTATVFIAAPITVTITNVSATSALVSWSPYAANSNVSYTVSWSGAAGSGSQSNAINPRLINGLNPSSVLNVTVSQNTPAGCTNTASASTSTLCSSPTGLTLNSTSSTTIAASWSGGASPYKIFWRKLDDNNPNFSSSIVSGTSYVIAGLSAGLEYEVYVASFNCPVANQVGQATPLAFATTLGGSSCTIPTMSVVSNCPSQITVTLSGSPTNQYFVYFKRMTPVAGSIVGYNFTGTTFNYNVSTAYAGSVYEVFAQSKCIGSVYSTECFPVFVTVKPQCPAISNLVLSNPTCHGFNASWNPDNCNGVGVSYSIYVRKVGSSSWNGYPAATNYFLFGILNPNTNYEVFVRSIGCANSVGLSSTLEQIATLVTCKDEEQTDLNSEMQNNQQVENLSNELSIYPNPNSGMFNFDYLSSNTEFHTVQIEVMNLLGQVLKTEVVEINSGILNHPINLSNDCASGIYFVRLTDGNCRTEKKFIIQH